MRKNFTKVFMFLFLGLTATTSFSQEHTFDDFVGTWHGHYTSNWSNIYDLPITMTINSDGSYTENTGHFMPTLYPNTQQCDFNGATNRFHWWYLSTVYAGQHFYQHFYYKVIHFQNDTLELHYNFWNDQEPNPDAGKLILVKESLTPSPSNLDLTLTDGEVTLIWEEPVNGTNSVEGLQGYNIYHENADNNEYELFASTQDTSFTLTGGMAVGLQSLYITAVYEESESQPSDIITIIFNTPEPITLQGEENGNSIVLTWDEPNRDSGAIAKFLGYNVYHNYNSTEFVQVEFTEETTFNHANLDLGFHDYYVTAVYEGGESEPSIKFGAYLAPTNINDVSINEIRVFPNPVNDYLYIDSAQEIQSIKLFDNSGKVVKFLKANGNQMTIPISGLSSGVYIIMVETLQGQTTNKLIVN